MSGILRAVTTRANADRPMLATAAFVVVLATMLLAAGPIYSEAVSLAGLQRTLELTPTDEANIQIAVNVNPDDISIFDEIATSEIARTFSSVDHEVNQSVVSDSYSLPSKSEAALDLAVFRYIGRIEDHASPVAGRWPNRSGEVIETAISDVIAEELDLSVGDAILMTNRRDQAAQQVVEIVGIYRATDSNDPFWFNDPLGLGGTTRSASFATHSPFVVTLETLMEDLPNVNTRLLWRVIIDYRSISGEDLSPLNRSLRGLGERLNGAAPPRFSSTMNEFQGFGVETSLRPILFQADRSLTVTRSGVLMMSIQLSIMAGVALALTAGLLVESRHVETQVLRSRGATNRQMVGLSVIEGALLTIPAALVAPWLGVFALSLLNHVGPLASIGLRLEPKPNGAAYLLSFLAAAGCMVALALPAYKSSRSHTESTSSQGRQSTSNESQRAGFDLALLVLAVTGFWQLNIHAETLSSSISGRFGVDPLLVGAPAIGLIAGSVLALRVVPFLARISEVLARRAAGAVLGLTAWQLSRRPRRYSRAVLLLTIAMCIGIFSMSYAATWSQSGADRAAFEVGADVRAFPNRTSDQAINDFHLAQALLAVDSQHVSMPVIRQSGGGSNSGSIRRFIILDTRRAGEVALLRSDLGPDFREAMQILAQGRPKLATIELPGHPRRIAAEIEVTVEPLEEDLEDATVCFCPSAAVVLQDGDGLLHRIELGTLEVDSGPQRLTADLRARLEDGTEISPRYPLSLVSLEINAQTPNSIARGATVSFGGIFVSEQDAEEPWELATEDLDQRSWDLTSTFAGGAFSDPSITIGGDSDDSLQLRLRTARAFERVSAPSIFAIRPTGTVIEGPFPVVTTRRFLDEKALQVGDEIRLPSLNTSDDVAEIVATIAEFPTVDPQSGEAVLVDLPTYQILRFEPGRAIPSAEEYWITTAAGHEHISDALSAAPFNSPNVIDRTEVADRNQTDPIAIGTMGSLFIGFVTAAIFACVGFAVSAVVSVRERMAEFAVVRALGVSNRQLGYWVVLEQGILVGVSLALGTLVGVLLSWVAVPLISVTQSGAAPLPDVRFIIPLANVLVLELVIAIVLGTIAGLLVRRLWRTALDSDFRLGIQ